MATQFTDSERIDRPSDWIGAAFNFVIMFFVIGALVHLAWRQLKGPTVPPFGLVLGIPALLSGVNAIVSVKGKRRRRRKRLEERRTSRLEAGLCPSCEYNLTGLTVPRCPECGTSIPASALLIPGLGGTSAPANGGGWESNPPGAA